jgi:NarL family two-component system sensor histidine kinase LiaS
MKRLFSFFHGLRGKLILTYTLVTVLALLGLEILILALVVFASSMTDIDKRAYLGDVFSTLYPQASGFLRPGDEDIAGLQNWLEGVYASGRASLEPQDAFDSPAALLAPSEPMVVLSPDGTVIAQAPREPSDLVGRKYAPPNDVDPNFLESALEGNVFNAMGLATLTPGGNYLMAVPVMRAGRDSEVVGVIVLTVEPPPPQIYQIWPVLLSWVGITAILLLIAVAPFGTLFGFFMSRPLTRRLGALSRAAQAWSEGDFQPLPLDRSNDEIGFLARQMRTMAERVQALLQTQQQLAMLEERNRLARELHDTVKQQTFATLMQLRAARNLLATQPEAALEHLAEAEGILKNSQQDLGIIIEGLRPAALEDQGLAAALREMLQRWSQQSKIPSSISVREERRLPLNVEQTLFRVAQEALSNVARHSRASAVSVLLEYQPGQVCLSVADNGVGYAPDGPAAAGYGLHSMSERLAAVGGTLRIQPGEEGGTVVSAAAPTN